LASKSDVIVDDVVNTATKPSFLPALTGVVVGGVDDVVYAATVNEARFFVASTLTASVRDDIRMERPFVVTSDRSVLGAAVGALGRVLSVVPRIANNAVAGAAAATPQPLQFLVRFRCRKAGTARVTVKLRFASALHGGDTIGTMPGDPLPAKGGPLAGGSGGGGKLAVRELTFQFAKVCASVGVGATQTPAVVSSTAVSSMLHVGLSATETTSVVVAGVVQPSFKSRSAAAAAAQSSLPPMRVFSFDDAAVDFYLASDDVTRTWVARPLLWVKDPRIVRCTVSGDIGTPVEASRTYARGKSHAFLRNNFSLAKATPRRVTVSFACLQAKKTMVIFAASVGTGGGVLRFAFEKDCTGFNDGKRVLGTGVRGLIVSTRADGDDVVFNGFTTAAFKPNAAPAFTVAASVSKLTFFIRLADAGATVAHESPVVTAQSEGTRPVCNPRLSGGGMTLKRFTSTPLSLSVEFHCALTGSAKVEVKIPLSPVGEVAFYVVKQCVVATPLPLPAPTAFISPKLCVGTTVLGHQVVFGGYLQDAYSDQAADLSKMRRVVAGQDLKLYFGICTKAKAGDKIGFAAPTATSSTAVAAPTLTGNLSTGGMLKMRHFRTLMVEFNCRAKGETVVSIVFPAFVADTDVKAEQKEFKITVVKECAGPVIKAVTPADVARADAQVRRLGGVPIDGFSVGINVMKSDIVKDGYPQGHYFGQRFKETPEWTDIVVPAKTLATTYFLSYTANGVFAAAAGSGDAAASSGSGFGVASNVETTAAPVNATAIAGSIDEDFIEFQAPSVFQARSLCAPQLSGDAARGGSLKRNGTPMQLDVDWRCQHAGLAVVTFEIPILPHGVVSFTIPKQCDGRPVPPGVYVPNLEIGTARFKSDVVYQGYTRPMYRTRSIKDSNVTVVDHLTDSTNFQVQPIKTWWKDKVFALEPSR
jgi:hypothetical protein